MATPKNQKFKLGKKASCFIYPAGRVKILPGQSVEISKEVQKHPYVKEAIIRGHIIAATAADKKALKDNTADEPTAFNPAKASKAALVEAILELENNEEDEDELTDRNKAELLNIYESLTSDEEEDDEDEDEEEEN